MKIYKRLFALLFGVCTFQSVTAQSFPVNELTVNGERDKRINIVFLGDGYTVDQINAFNEDARGVADALFITEPFQTYKKYFNIYSIEVVSEETGSTHPGTADDEPSGTQVFSSNTYFKSTFDLGRIHRLLGVQDYSAVYSVLGNNFPDWDIVFIIVNHEYYGGSGGTFAVTSVNRNSFEVAIHELGHSFSHLADEYDYGSSSQNGYEAPNATAATSYQNIKWNKWILPETPLPTPETSEYSNVIGLFEGAVYSSTGWYRPKLYCKMRALNWPFCEVCAEQTVLSIYNYLNVIDEYSPMEPEQSIAANGIKQFSVKTIEDDFKRISLQWYWDNELISENQESVYIDAAGKTEGLHKLKVTARDNTDFVINDSNKLLTSEFEWNVMIGNTSAAGKGALEYDYYLGQNYPNPFNPSTKIKYSISRSGITALKVYDIFGRELETLAEGYLAAGEYETMFNASELSSGVYFYVLTSGEFRSVRKLILLK